MGRQYYDLHLHSCLSPCGDDDMTPNDLVNMAMLNGLSVIALTDHNSCGNCAAAMKAAERAGIILVPGMELTTAEEIHVVCLFPDLESALRFDAMVYDRIPPVKNRKEIFGNQYFRNEEDEITGEEEKLLILATDIGIYDVPALAEAYGGIAVLAHIDRHSNSVLGVLSDIDPLMGFRLAEVSRAADPAYYKERYGFLRFLNSSDAHDLLTIGEPGKSNYWEGNCKTAADVIEKLKEL